MRTDWRGFFSYEVLENPFGIGQSEALTVFESLVVGIFVLIWLKISSRNTKWGTKKRHIMGSFVTSGLVSRRDFFPREQIEATHNLRAEMEKVRCSKKSGIFCGITKRALGDRPLQRGGRETFGITNFLSFFWTEKHPDRVSGCTFFRLKRSYYR